MEERTAVSELINERPLMPSHSVKVMPGATLDPLAREQFSVASLMRE